MKIPISPQNPLNSLNTSEIAQNQGINRDKIGANTESPALSVSFFDWLQEVAERKKMQFFQPIPLAHYKLCRLCQGKDWYVYYYVIHPDTQRLKRVRIKVNSVRPIRERRRMAKEMMAALDQRLSLGWNPFLEERAPRSYHRLFDAFDAFLAVKQRELEENSMRSYRSLVAIFKAWLLDHGFQDDAYANSVRMEAAVAFMDDYETKLAVKTYNNYVAFFRILFNWMVNKGYTDTNPFDGIEKKARRRGSKNRRILTDEELAHLIAFLQRENVPYLAMCLICYCCLIRPKEIAMLRCCDVDLQKQTIHVSASIAKNDSDSFRTIPDDLVPILRMLDYGRPDHYLFADHNGWDFRPGVKMVCSRKIAKYWDVVVRPACGFGLDVKFYSLKDSGITNMLTDGVPVNLVRQQADHSSIAMTAVYVGTKANAQEEIRKAGILRM
jgi:integrase